MDVPECPNNCSASICKRRSRANPIRMPVSSPLTGKLISPFVQSVDRAASTWQSSCFRLRASTVCDIWAISGYLRYPGQYGPRAIFRILGNWNVQSCCTGLSCNVFRRLVFCRLGKKTNNNNKDQRNLAKGGIAVASPPNSLFVFARWQQVYLSNGI